MSEFKPGDKVKDRGGEEYTIEFGPYDSESGPSYLVKDAAGNGYPCAAAFLSPVPPEDPRVDVVAKAIARFYDNESIADESEDAAYAVLAALDAMPKAREPRVGDRVRIVSVYKEGADDLDHLKGREGELVSVDDSDPHLPYKVRLGRHDIWWCYAVESVESAPEPRPLAAREVLAALDAMPQEKPAPRRVRDRDGDVWEESDWGTWIGVTFPADTCGSYRELAEEWGPLTDV